MYIFIFVITFVVCFCDIKVSIDKLKGDYNISINNRVWLRSSYAGLYSNNQWYTSKDGTFRLIDLYLNEGNDSILGEWNETVLVYNLNENERIINITGRIRQWKCQSAITFYFDSGLIDLNNDILLDMDRVRTVFPSFIIEKIDENDHRAYLTFGGI